MSTGNCFEVMMKRWRKKDFTSKYTVDEDVQQVFIAISEGKLRLARILIERKVNVNCTDNAGRTPLMALCRLNNSRINEEHRLSFVKFLLNEEETILNATDMFGKQALDYACENELHQVVKVISRAIEDFFNNLLVEF
ncbi:ankyrin repeat domain-containing protein 34B-like [Mytilus trossulus]|uniref:ankyrin repeat domain-containing protein 34B-like n=1 Tax=Mytilus trossulus TaxID=6551 RepID=UPI0030071111